MTKRSGSIYFSMMLWAMLFCAVHVLKTTSEVSADGYEYVYEDELEDAYEYVYEDEEEAAVNVGINGEVTLGESEAEVAKKTAFKGFYSNVGGGIIRISKKLVDEIYMNETSDYYDCVKRMDSGILALDIIEDEEEAEEAVLQKQIDDLRQQLDAAAGVVNGIEETVTEVSVNETEVIAAQTNLKLSMKRKQVTFREKQALKMQARLDVEMEKEAKRPKFRLGADCETLVCGACKAVVEEFADLVYNKIDDPDVRYIDQVTKGMCKTRNFVVKYSPIVTDICENFEIESLGFKETLITPFEEDGDWENINKFLSINAKKQKICLSVGACEEEQFVFQTTPIFTIQENWDAKCFVCQAFAKDLEERMQLQKYLTETSIVPLVRSTCARLSLPKGYAELCQPLVQDKMLDDISWLAKVHGETVARKAKGEQRFGDKLCEEINYCEKWMEAEKLKETIAQKSMDMVFF